MFYHNLPKSRGKTLYVWLKVFISKTGIAEILNLFVNEQKVSALDKQLKWVAIPITIFFLKL